MEQPGLLISWGILNPTWNNDIGSRFGPNLYAKPGRNLFWSAGCPLSSVFDPLSPCWRNNETEIDSTTGTLGNAVEGVTFKVSISSTFSVQIFLYKCCFGSFLYLYVTREKLPKQRSYEKFVRKC
jgi:hypothetical protein